MALSLAEELVLQSNQDSSHSQQMFPVIVVSLNGFGKLLEVKSDSALMFQFPLETVLALQSVQLARMVEYAPKINVFVHLATAVTSAKALQVLLLSAVEASIIFG
eukprot:CAMPEP_0176418812 /NCGR_PEP_ID=MMETSP0127-20121128/7691_1 /TAXON_ID=938130 /ORGANISM="Platyophrya macrostoma, Strain WH" /LENGTH=104 /DNA_ID=CAMNT_0017799203 /DNA_START=410 /DNA_END=724 /DNA_ORIENTATION=+